MQEIANLIPADERREMLQLNVIAAAVPDKTNQAMHHLLVIWRTYVEPDLSADCPRCLDRVLHNFREIQPVLIEMEKQTQLLKGI